MFFDDIKTLYDLEAPESARVRGGADVQRLPQGSDGAARQPDVSAAQDLKVIDLDTAKAFAPAKDGGATTVKLDVPITDDRQSAHIKITGTLPGPDTRRERRPGVRSDAAWPAQHRRCCLRDGTWWRVSQSGTIGTYEGRTFVALINLNAENSYHVVIHARKSGILGRSRAGRMPAPDRRLARAIAPVTSMRPAHRSPW